MRHDNQVALENKQKEKVITFVFFALLETGKLFILVLP